MVREVLGEKTEEAAKGWLRFRGWLNET